MNIAIDVPEKITSESFKVIRVKDYYPQGKSDTYRAYREAKALLDDLRKVGKYGILLLDESTYGQKHMSPFKYTAHRAGGRYVKEIFSSIAVSYDNEIQIIKYAYENDQPLILTALNRDMIEQSVSSL